MDMPNYQDESWDVYRSSEAPEFDRQDDVNDRVDEPGGVEDD